MDRGKVATLTEVPLHLELKEEPISELSQEEECTLGVDRSVW